MSITKLYAGIEGDPLNSSGTQVKDSVNSLIDAHVPNLKVLPLAPQTDVIYNVALYCSGSNITGGQFIWSPSANKSNHNGKTIIAPEALSVWGGTLSTLSTLLNWTGSGNGVYEMIGSFSVQSGKTLQLAVPSNFADVKAAIDWLQICDIDGVVDIQISDGTYTWGRSQYLNHRNGRNIRIIGNQTTPSNVTIFGTNPTTFDMFVVDDGCEIGFIDGLYVNVLSKMGQSNNFTAILANKDAAIKLGSKIKTNNWYYGIAARDGSDVYCRYAEVSNSGDVGIWSFNGSFIDAQYAKSTGANDSVNGLGFGFQAEYGATIDCSNSEASGCYIAGIAALSNGSVRAHNAVSSNNTGSGFYASSEGHIEHHGAIANTNNRYGEERNKGGVIDGSSITLTGNILGAFNTYVQVVNQPSGISVFGTGDNDFGVKGTGNGRVHLANHRQNYLSVQGANAGNPPALTPEGTDTHIDYYVAPKGTSGRYLLKRDNIPEFADDAAASAGGLPLGRLYRTGSIIKIRMT